VSNAKGKAHTGDMGMDRKPTNMKVFEVPTAEELIQNLKATEVNMRRGSGMK
jgi:hypothetical protein